MLLGAPGLTTRNKKLLGAKGIATRNKKLLEKDWIKNKKVLETNYAEYISIRLEAMAIAIGLEAIERRRKIKRLKKGNVLASL